MELETINKLYLELSQVATAITADEMALAQRVARLKELLRDIRANHSLSQELHDRIADELK